MDWLNKKKKKIFTPAKIFKFSAYKIFHRLYSTILYILLVKISFSFQNEKPRIFDPDIFHSLYFPLSWKRKYFIRTFRQTDIKKLPSNSFKLFLLLNGEPTGFPPPFFPFRVQLKHRPIDRKTLTQLLVSSSGTMREKVGLWASTSS